MQTERMIPMKKFLALLLSLVLAAALTVPAFAEEVPVENAQAVTMVPLRAVAEALGYTVSWDGSLPGARLTRGSLQAVVVLGQSYAAIISDPTADPVMGNPLPLPAAPAFLAPGTIYVPVEFFAGDGVKVKADGTITVNISTTPTVQIPSPIHSHDSLEALEAAVGFTVPAPAAPVGFTASTIQDIGGTVAELRWTDEIQELTFRVSRGSNDNSGDYTVYPETATLTLNGTAVQLRGQSGHIHLALWTADGFAYSLRANDGLTENQVRQMIGGIV